MPVFPAMLCNQSRWFHGWTIADVRHWGRGGRWPIPIRQQIDVTSAGFDDAHEIGVGGFGVVYRCQQRSLERTVAIKGLTAYLDSDNLERFLREQRAMGKLSRHPNIVNIFQVGAAESGRPYIVMQYHPRNSLKQRIDHAGHTHLGGSASRWRQDRRCTRDSTPALCIATSNRQTSCLPTYGEPQLSDFGIARIVAGFETATGVVVGSPAFTAP